MSKGKKTTRKLIPVGSETLSVLATHGPFSQIGHTAVRIDFSKLPPPDRLYDADTTEARRGAGYVSLAFGKLDYDDDAKMLTRLEIKMAPEAFLAHFWENGEEFLRGLREHISQWPKDPLLAPKDGAGFSAEKTHSEWANFTVLARSGGHATVDFYYLPPFNASQFAKGAGVKALDMSAVVRVLLTIHQVNRLFEQAAPVIEEVKKYLPEELIAAMRTGTEEGAN